MKKIIKKMDERNNNKKIIKLNCLIEWLSEEMNE